MNALSNIIGCQVDQSLNYVEKLSAKKYAFYLLPICTTIISLISAFPSYDIVLTNEFAEGWRALLNQTDHPFQAVDYHQASHAANLAFRLTPVLLGRLFQIDTIPGYLLLQLAAFLLLQISTVCIFKKITGDMVTAILLSFAVSFSFVGNVLCSDYRGFFDVLSFLFLTIAMLSDNLFIIFVSILAASFTDERALAASGLVFIFFVLQGETNTEAPSSLKNLLRLDRKLFTLILSWVVYFMLRYLLSYYFNFKTNESGMIDYLLNHAVHQINILPFALWTGLEGFWLIVILSIYILIYNKRWSFLLLLFAAITGVAFIAIWVFDITRSMAYLWPAIFIGVTILYRTQNLRFIRYISFAVLLLCFFPTYYAGGPKEIGWLYPLPVQLLRMFLKV